MYCQLKMPSQHTKGTLIWVRDEEHVWQSAEIIAVSEVDSQYIIRTVDNEEFRISQSDNIFLRNVDEYSADGLVVLDDLTQLTHLHEPAVLHSLQMRFDIDKIYTFTGPILIAVNPFKRIPHLYTRETLDSFIREKPVPNPTPHVFTTAFAAFYALCNSLRKQTILISGESGAGKTDVQVISE